MKIEVEVDQVMGPALLEAMEMTYDAIVELREQEVLENYQMSDLEYNLQLLPALKTVYKYYSVHTEHYKLNEYDILDIDLNKSGWFCNKCHVGVLDKDKKVLTANHLEFVVICPECSHPNPEFSFTDG